MLSRQICTALVALIMDAVSARLGQAGEPAHKSADFAFVLSDEHGFRIDSRSGRITKDMVVGPDTTIYAPFTAEEMDSLATLVRRTALMSLVRQPRPETRWDESVDPQWSDTLDVTLGGVHARWCWQEPKRRPGAPGEWTLLFTLVDEIFRVATAKEGYRRLPEVRGGYL